MDTQEILEEWGWINKGVLKTDRRTLTDPANTSFSCPQLQAQLAVFSPVTGSCPPLVSASLQTTSLFLVWVRCPSLGSHSSQVINHVIWILLGNFYFFFFPSLSSPVPSSTSLVLSCLNTRTLLTSYFHYWMPMILKLWLVSEITEKHSKIWRPRPCATSASLDLCALY